MKDDVATTAPVEPPDVDDAILALDPAWRRYGVPLGVLSLGVAATIWAYFVVPSATQELASLLPSVILYGGAILSLLMAYALWSAGTRRAAAAEIARRVTSSLRQSEHRLHGDFG